MSSQIARPVRRDTESWNLHTREELRRELDQIGARLQAAAYNSEIPDEDLVPMGVQLASISQHLESHLEYRPTPALPPSPHPAMTPARLYQQCLEMREHLLFMQTGQQQNTVARAVDALSHLRKCTTYDALAIALPRAVVSLGFGRALFSRVSRMQWIAEAGFSARNPREGGRWVEIGSRPPYRELRGLFEHEVVVGRTAIIASATHSRQRVHPELHAAMQSHAYVAAPIEVGSKVIGFISADQSSRSGSVDELDREVLSILCQGAGLILERMPQTEIQASAGQRRGFVTSQDTTVPLIGPALTNRESEVARLLTRGMTNREIATELQIAETTAKIHVKHIMQKLGAVNRTEATALLLDTKQRGTVSAWTASLAKAPVQWGL